MFHLLLAVAGGTGAYTIKFFTDGNNLFGYMFLIVLMISSVGTFVNYEKLNEIEKKIGELENV